MHPLSRRRFLLSSAAIAATPLLARLFAEDKKPAADNPIPAANTAFGCDLFAKLRAEKGNVFFSPFSIESALAMTALGAKGNTLTEMQQTLHLPADVERTNAGFKTLLATLNGDGKPADKRGYELSVANALWGMKGYPWRQAFLKASKASFGAGLQEVNFADEPAARKTINDWVEANTNQKIKDLIPSGVLDSYTRMVLTNAVYFKGKWEFEFDKKLTKDGPFTPADGKKADVPLMHRTDDMRYAEGEGWQAVDLGYKGNETAMTVLLPKKADGLADLEKRFTPDTLATVVKGLRRQEVILTLPRFKVETKYTLNGPLTALGMKDAFDDGKADFSGMHTSPEGLFISHVLHKAFVEVNEEGTEAAAATGVVMKTASASVDGPKVFKADRPFLFVIRHTPTNTVLFAGRFEKP
jgi:serpin B